MNGAVRPDSSSVSPRVPDRLYRMLPALYRQRDAAVGEPLRALLALIDDVVVGPVEADIAGLLDDAFIETCAPWVVPYLGDLLGVGPLRDHPGGGVTSRAYVANTIAYRRRKGTAAVAEQVARDVTGWPTRAVEQFRRLAAAQHLDHVRPECRTADLRAASDLELTGGPFEPVMRTVDVRAADRGRGRTNLPNLTLHRWRLDAHRLERSEARHVEDGSDPAAVGWRYQLDPLGRDVAAVNVARSEEDIATLAEELDVPAGLRRRPLHAELDARRTVLAQGGGAVDLRASARWYRDVIGQRSAFTIDVDGVDVPPEQQHIAHLARWRPAPSGASDPSVSVAIDPVLGRLVVRREPAPAADTPVPVVRVNWAYGAGGDLGAGPYDRRRGVAIWRDHSDLPVFAGRWQLAVARDPAVVADNPDPDQLVGSLTEALARWRAQPPRTDGTIVVLDSSTYAEDLVGAATVTVPDGARLAIVAAGWPLEPDPDAVGLLRRQPHALDPTRVRPVLRGLLAVQGVPGASPDDDGGTFVLDGLAVDGSVTITAGSLGSLVVSQVTLVPDRGGLTVEGSAVSTVTARRAVLGPLAAGAATLVTVADSVVDTITAPQATLDLASVTVFGPVDCRQLAASDTIFAAPVTVQRRQAHDDDDRACVRYSYVAPGSSVPRRFRCQPDLAVAAADLAAGGAGRASPEEVARAAASVVPAFASRTFGDAAFGRLDRSCPVAIAAGGEDDTEMGAFRFVATPWRAANGAVAVADMVRFGTVTGVVEET